MPAVAPRRVRKQVFGQDPWTYDHARLPYPRRVFDILTSRCGLGPGTAAFEIGPGTGIVTRDLLRRGAGPITVIEPDPRLVRYLSSSLGPDAARVHIEPVPFEKVVLPRAGFDLGVAATSFHWLPERSALRKVARALRPGGWWVAWGNRYGRSFRSNAFHRAIQPLYRELYGRPAARPTWRSDVARDRRDRLRALREVGAFDRISFEEVERIETVNSARVAALWGTFSEVLTLPRRKRVWFLTELERVADERFAGQVPLPVRTPIYTARRR
ncbi:MAG: class I SAM-dependent methyltransferase [Thermoplasmata archaeon]